MERRGSAEDRSTAKPASDSRSSSGGWLFSPAADLMSIANLWWVAAAWPGWLLTDGTSMLEFWQVYFLSTPHRWLTLLLVASDPERRTERPRRLIWWAVGLLACVVAVPIAGYSVTCLLVVDYLWNAWHFGAQHGGILRIYSRRDGGPAWRHEAWVMRTLVPYTSLRLAGWTTGWMAADSPAVMALRGLDIAIAGVAVAWCVREWLVGPAVRLAKCSYATSVIAIYVSLLLAVDRQSVRWIATLVVASAAFHAVEYLAIVTYYAERRRTTGRAAWIQRLARQWLAVLVVFLIGIAVVGWWGDRRWPTVWLGVNLWVAFLHYAYDGLIWKLRQPATAERLAVSGSP
ncbi:MAG: hypothetical protein U0795_07015 [Pirellulales bacterium]